MKSISNTTDFLVLLLVLCPLFLFPQWTWLNPKPQGNRLNDITFTDSLNGIVVGNYGTILRTEDGGQNWSLTRMDSTLNMTCIFYAENSMVYVSTDNGRILKSDNSGDSWKILDPGYHIRINSIWFTSKDTGYAAGPAWIMKTTTAGLSWTRQAFGPYDEFFSVYFTTPDSGFIAGKYGKIFRTSDAGNTWQNCFTFTDYDIYSMSFTDSQRGFASCEYSVLFTSNGGVSWNQINSKSKLTDNNDIYFMNPDTGFLATSYGSIRRTIDAGVSWTGFPGSRNGLHSLYFIDENKGFAAGDYGTIFQTDNCGETWTSVTTIYDDVFYDAFFLNNDTGFVAAYSDVFKTYDGGTSWSQLNMDEFHDGFRQIIFTDHNTGYIPGDQGRIIKTTDGGTSWNYINTGFTESEQYASLCFPSKDTAYVIGRKHVLRTIDAGDTWAEVLYYENLGYGDMRFFDNYTGVLKYGANVFHTSDAGQTWEHTTTSAPYGTSFFLNPDTGYALSQYNALNRTHDGGQTWHFVAVLPYEPYGVYFTGYNTGYFYCTYESLYKTTDAGETWTKQVYGTTNYFRFMYFSDTSIAYAGGEGGMILKYDADFPVEIPEEMPEENLLKAFPNPFRDKITLSFFLEHQEKVSYEIYDVNGRLIRRVNLAKLPKGDHNITIDGKGLPDGVYILTLFKGKRPESIKILKNTDF